MGKIVTGVIAIVIGFFPLFLVGMSILLGVIPVNNPGILLLLFAFGLIFVAGIYNIASGVRMRKAAKLQKLSQLGQA